MKRRLLGREGDRSMANGFPWEAGNGADSIRVDSRRTGLTNQKNYVY
jgi:hypothetical protein